MGNVAAGNYADFIMISEQSLADFDELMLQHIKKANEEKMSNLFRERAKNGMSVIDLFLKKQKKELLCAIIDRMPNAVTLSDGRDFMVNVAKCKMEDVCIYAIQKRPELCKVQDEFGNTFLHVAVANGLLKVFDMVKDNPETYVCNAKGQTYLHFSAGKTEYVDSWLQILQQHPECASIQDEHGGTFLHYDACSILKLSDEEIARRKAVYLEALKDPILPFLQDEHGNTFLHYAAALPQLNEVCIKALSVPGLANIQNNNGDTFLHMAAFAGNNELCNAANGQVEDVPNRFKETYHSILASGNRMTQKTLPTITVPASPDISQGWKNPFLEKIK